MKMKSSRDAICMKYTHIYLSNCTKLRQNLIEKQAVTPAFLTKQIMIIQKYQQTNEI